MANVVGLEAVFGKEGRLEGEDAEQPLEHLPHERDTPFAPGPDLRRDQVNHRNPLPFQLAGQAEMEIGAIGQDGELGAFPPGGFDQLAELAVDAGNLAKHLDQADHGERGGVDDGTHASAAHAGSCTSEEISVGESASKSQDQFRGIQVTGRFARGNKNLRGHCR